MTNRSAIHSRLFRAAGVFGLAIFGCMALQARAEACKDPLSARIANSCIVSKDILWRGAKPDEAAATELVNRGVRTVVNLELAHDDRDAFRESRPGIAQAMEIGYFRIREWEPNVVLAVDRLDRHVAEFIAITRSQPKPIYVHCRSGQNRTGVMVAAYRVIEEMQPIDSAVAEMGGFQGIWFKQDAEYIRQLVGERAARLRAMAGARVDALRPEAQLLCSSAGCRTQ